MTVTAAPANDRHPPAASVPRPTNDRLRRILYVEKGAFSVGLMDAGDLIAKHGIAIILILAASAGIGILLAGGAPDSGCVYRSVPCGSPIANSVETVANGRGLEMGIKGLVVPQDAPGDAGKLVG